MKNKSINRIIIFLGVLIFLAITVIGFTDGVAMSSLVWNGDSCGIFPDLFESIRDASDRKPYDGHSIYPAFAYFICWILSQFAPGDKTDWATYSLSANGNIVGFFFFMFCTMALFVAGYQLLKNYKGKALIVLVLLSFSPGYIYCIERGNMVILTVFFLLLFVGWYDSEIQYEREIAFIALAFAASMKIYPAVFGILLLFEKNWKNVIKTLFYGITIFTIPFFMFGGLNRIGSMIKNIAYLSGETFTDERNFGYGYKINIKNFIVAICDWLNIDNGLCDILCLFGTILLIASVVIIVVLVSEKWKKVWALTLLLTMLPTFSWIYNALYFIVPLLIYLKECKMAKINALYDIFFVLIFAPLPYGYIMKSLEGVNKISYSTVAVFCASCLMTFTIIVELVLKKLRHSK